MATPCRPLARALAIKSSGLETPSAEKKVWVWRSTLNAMVRTLVCRGRNGKHRFQRMVVSLQCPWARRAIAHLAQGWNGGGQGRFLLSPSRVLSVPDIFSRATRKGAEWV